MHLSTKSIFMLAERLCPYLTLADEAHDAAFGIVVFLFQDFDIDNVARYAERHKDNHVVVMKQTFALRGNGLNANVL